MSGQVVLPSVASSLLLLLFRVGAGVGWMRHGLTKARGGAWKGAGEWIKSMGIPAGLALPVTALEVGGGIFLILGVIVPIVGALFLLLMLGIIPMKVYRMKATFLPKGQGAPSYEIDFVYLLVAIALVAFGAGSLSLDAIVGLY